MPKGKRFSPEQIITKLREAEILLSQEKSVEETARILEIAPQTCYRWRKEYGEMTQTQASSIPVKNSCLVGSVDSMAQPKRDAYSHRPLRILKLGSVE